MHRVLLLGAALLGLLAGAIAQAPAEQLLSRLPLAAHGVTLRAVEGRVLAGRVDGVNVRGVELGTVEWQLSLLPLLWGRLAGDATLAGNIYRGAARFNIGSDYRLQDLELTLPVSALTAAGLQLPFPAPIAGRASLSFSELSGPMRDVGPGLPTTGLGHVRVDRLRLGSPFNMELGSYQGDLLPSTTGLMATVRDLSGPLALQGRVGLQDARWTFEAQLTPRQTAPPALRQGLELLAPVDARGAHALSLRGQLSP